MSSDLNAGSFWEAVDRIRERDKRYARDAYALVMDSLEFAIQRVGERRHLSATELLVHLCDYAQERYGVLAYSVLENWGIRSSEDVGSVVYRLIDEEILSEQDGDSPIDFSGGFDFRGRLEDRYFDRVDKQSRRNPKTG
ncbi:MAG: hypothetical protein KAJ17_13785 [Candidatus Krumholzibacteria bacterium]|nr:hypothetical protein [Candidatus Krumholzibacteria bacterium]